MAWDREAWERLGDYVTSARVRAKMDRQDLSEGAHLSLRTLADIENGELGKRKAFSAETLEAIGLCVGWAPGSWRRVLNGQEPIWDEREVGRDQPDEELSPPLLVPPMELDQQTVTRFIEAFQAAGLRHSETEPDYWMTGSENVGGVAIQLKNGVARNPELVEQHLVALVQLLVTDEGVPAEEVRVTMIEPDQQEWPLRYEVDVVHHLFGSGKTQAFVEAMRRGAEQDEPPESPAEPTRSGETA